MDRIKKKVKIKFMRDYYTVAKYLYIVAAFLR